MFRFTIRDVLWRGGLLLIFVAYPCFLFAIPDNSDDVTMAGYTMIGAIVAWAITVYAISLRSKTPPKDT